jgi:hypothetical protein
VQVEKPKFFTVGNAIGNFLKSYRLKILSGGRKPRTYDAIEDILVAFKAATGEETPLAAVTRESAITYIATLKKRTGEDTTKTTKENHFIYIQKMLRASGVNLFEEGAVSFVAQPWRVWGAGGADRLASGALAGGGVAGGSLPGSDLLRQC